MKINLIAILTCKKDALATIQMELKKLAVASKAEEGCLLYELYNCEEMPTQYVITELWGNEDALKRHKETPHYKYFTHIAPALLVNPVELKTLIPVL